MGVKRIGAIALLAAMGLGTAAAALDLPRGTLWRVDQTCRLNQSTTGSPFPCLAVDEAAGTAVLRAPFRPTHIVLMPLARMSGIEAPALRLPGGSALFAHAWDARHFVEEEVRHPLGWDDLGLAVNSAYTRSQDQLHIHVDCLRERVKREIAARAPGLPTASWQPGAYLFNGQSFWARRLDGTDLAAADVMGLVDEIAPLRAHPERTTMAVVGTRAGGEPGFVLLASEHRPELGAEQWTAEAMLDHRCRRKGG